MVQNSLIFLLLFSLSVWAAPLIPNSAVTSAKILDGTIASGDISSGAITTEKILDGTIASGDLSAGAITATSILDGTITSVKRADINVVSSTGSSTYSTASATAYYTDVTSTSATITTTGKPVHVMFIPDGSANTAYVGIKNETTTAEVTGLYKVLRDAVVVGIVTVTLGEIEAGRASYVPPGALSMIDYPTAGTYVYKLQSMATTTAGNSTSHVKYTKILLHEL